MMYFIFKVKFLTFFEDWNISFLSKKSMIKLNEDTGECFDKDFNWRKFYETSMKLLS